MNKYLIFRNLFWIFFWVLQIIIISANNFYNPHLYFFIGVVVVPLWWVGFPIAIILIKKDSNLDKFQNAYQKKWKNIAENMVYPEHENNKTTLENEVENASQIKSKYNSLKPLIYFHANTFYLLNIYLFLSYSLIGKSINLPTINDWYLIVIFLFFLLTELIISWKINKLVAKM